MAQLTGGPGGPVLLSIGHSVVGGSVSSGGTTKPERHSVSFWSA